MTARRQTARVQKVLRQVFGIAELRPGQREVIDAVLARRHTLAIMPTGAGKSLCYQVPAMLMAGMTLVISPQIALMRDQFEKLSGLGLEAVQVNSAIPTDDIRQQMIVYAQTALCRTRVLLEALGETVEWSQCGTCDNCRGVAVRPEAPAAGAA